MYDLIHPVAVVAHDAGAANLIISWLKILDKPIRPYFEGPAARLWDAVYPGEPCCSSVCDALDGSRSLISGTGWSSCLEHNARVFAQKLGIHSVAVLDHWVNYPQRFERYGKVQLPDEIWVADTEARCLANQALPGVPVRQLDNLYLAEQVSRITSPPGNGTVLFLLEPVRSSWGKTLDGEFQALDYFFERLDYLFLNKVSQVVLRPHPSESLDKYSMWVMRDSRVSLDTSPDVASAISRADLVVGIESFALTVALAAGRQVYSCLPPWAPPLRLPQAGIQQIRHMNPS